MGTKKSPLENRSKWVSFRVSSQEQRALKELQLATGQTAGEVLRQLIRGQTLKPMPPLRPFFDNKVVIQLQHIGNNINQIARELYRHERRGVTPEEFNHLVEGIHSIIRATTHGKPENIIAAADGLKDLAQPIEPPAK